QPAGAVSARGEAMYTNLGTFEVTSGTLVVSDPCYGRDVWCQGQLDGVKCGAWQARVARVEETGWGTRNTELLVHLAGETLWSAGSWTEAPFQVGVDSGRAGFWDLPSYGWGEGEYGDTETFYGKACSTADGGVDA